MSLYEQLMSIREAALSEGTGPFEWRMSNLDWADCKRDLEAYQTFGFDGMATAKREIFGYSVVIEAGRDDGHIELLPVSQ